MPSIESATNRKHPFHPRGHDLQEIAWKHRNRFMSLASINDQHNDSAQIKRKSLNARLVVPNRSTDDDDDVDGDYDIRYKALFKASAWL